MDIFSSLNDSFFDDFSINTNSFIDRNLFEDSSSFLFKENIFEEPEDIVNNSENIKLFKIIKVKKRGRKRQNGFSRKKRNRALDKDNIICTIQIHFLNFLINFANDAIKAEFKDKRKINLEFKKINHKIKKKISSKKMNKLIQSPISSILQLEISKKYKKLSLDKDYNKNIYNEIIALSEWLKKLFNMNFVDAFKLYYNDGESLDSIEFNGKVINLSNKTKNFKSLYNEAGNEEKKSRLKSIAESYYSKLRKQNNFEGEIFIEI